MAEDAPADFRSPNQPTGRPPERVGRTTPNGGTFAVASHDDDGALEIVEFDDADQAIARTYCKASHSIEGGPSDSEGREESDTDDDTTSCGTVKFRFGETEYVAELTVDGWKVAGLEPLAGLLDRLASLSNYGPADGFPTYCAIFEAAKLLKGYGYVAPFPKAPPGTVY